MQRRPLALILASCVFLLSPILFVLQMAEGESPSAADYFLRGLLPVLLCVGLLRVNRVAWYTLFGFVFLWGVRELQGLQFIIYVLGLTYFINPRIRRLYFDPKLQWWRTKTRHETHGPTIVQAGTKTIYPALRNISEGGCFLETPHVQEPKDQIMITIPLPSPIPDSCLRLLGEVRWASLSPEKMGMGVQFLSLNRIDKLNLKKFIAQH